MSLSSAQIEQFIEDGFVRLDAVLPTARVDAVSRRVWSRIAADPHEPRSWPAGATKLGDLTDGPEAGLLNANELSALYDQLVGTGRWRPFKATPDVRIAFPEDGDRGDWHVDVNDGEGADPLDPFSWRVSLASQDFGLLVSTILSDIPEGAEATVLRLGSHRALAAGLADCGPDGIALRDLMRGGFPESEQAPQTTVWGPAGTVFLCHPFMVHAACPNRGSAPRIWSVGVLETVRPWAFGGARPSQTPPVEEAVWRALSRHP
jgi:hypothetical protein